jgi:tetratricopeptide (TPR) repeat protein
MSAWLVAVFAQAVAVARAAPEVSSTALVTVAEASTRPAECTPPHGARTTLWQRARSPKLAAYCDLLGRGYARLERAPEQALEAGKQASQAWPDGVAARVLEGRALLALGRYGEALARLIEARERSSRSLEAPGALHDLGTAALLAGRSEVALSAYRSLVPRAGLLGDALRRQNVYVEAAAVVMQASALDEAVGYLGEARRRGSPPGTRDVVLAALALALDRQGRMDEARGVAAEASGPYLLAARAAEQRGDASKEADAEPPKPQAPAAAEAVPDRSWPVLPPGELDAMVAILAERSDRELAREAWRSFLASPASRGPWADHARKHLVSLEAPRARGGGR